ncbi:hypothetical protein M2O40_003169 [Kluyvera ascorbata]
MNRCILPILSCRSGVDILPATPISALHTSRCYTHFGASQDSRAGR